jgi:hypothetical protein
LWVAIRGCRNAHGGSFVPGGVRIVSYEPHVLGTLLVGAPNTNLESAGAAPTLS